jgi:glycosyltransferase involved in cell wall biosynthesis
VRLTVVQTHPVQYNAPWFRYLAANCPEIALNVVYAARPRPEQQGAGFDEAFTWDTPLLDGYSWHIVREGREGDDFSTARFRGLDVAGIGQAIADTRPDVVLIPGWYSVTLVRALLSARRRGVPILYRGDTHNATAPAGWRRAIWHARTRAFLSLYSGYLSVGRLSRAYLETHGVSATTIFSSPHAVDNDWFAGSAAPWLADAARRQARGVCGAEAGDFVVLFAGKIEARKRPIEAVRAVASLGPRAVLVFAGSGDREDEARAEAERLGVRVSWLGFVNQSTMGRVYAAADCLIVPSDVESWGLVVNEAMATGLPAVVTDRVGCAPDLIVPGETGEVCRRGDLDALSAALQRVRDRGGRPSMAAACRARVARHGFEAAATGLLAACQSLTRRDAETPRVVACCGGMVIVSGLERMTFEVLNVVRKRGGAVHCIVNGWENHRIVELAERIGATWSTGFYWYSFAERPKTPLHVLQMLWDMLRTSAGLAKVALQFGPTHVLVPEYAAVLRNAPVLALLRLLGVDVVFRIANAPERGRIHDVLWRRVLPPFVTRFVPNSRFSYGRLQETGVPEGKITLIRNAISRRRISPHTDGEVVQLAAARRTIVTVGQIAPFKGTHLVIEATLRLLADGVDVQTIVVGLVPSWPPQLVDYVDGLRQQIATAGATGRIHFVGARENVLDIMKAGYVLAAPILQEETFGNVALEARSVGLPVVAFARGGLTELVNHGTTGYICASADLAGLLQGLRHYLTQPAERAAASAHSLDASAAPGNDCTPGEFERRWWAMFEQAS